MSVNLKPCPFCGGPAKTPIKYDGCLQTSCAGDFKDCAGADALAPIAYWNTRAPDPAVAALEAEVARLRIALRMIELRGAGIFEPKHVGETIRYIAGSALYPAPSEKEAG